MTVKVLYPIPRIDVSLEQLAGAQWFSSLDLNAEYWQVEVNEADREKTAFTSRRGLFGFKTMPFGLFKAPATFERLMEVLGQNGPWTKRTRQNGPRFRTKRTTSKDKTDHVPGQNGPGFRKERTRFLDKTGPVLG